MNDAVGLLSAAITPHNASFSEATQFIADQMDTRSLDFFQTLLQVCHLGGLDSNVLFLSFSLLTKYCDPRSAGDIRREVSHELLSVARAHFDYRTAAVRRAAANLFTTVACLDYEMIVDEGILDSFLEVLQSAATHPPEFVESVLWVLNRLLSDLVLDNEQQVSAFANQAL
jgi:hypothetical protein